MTNNSDNLRAAMQQDLGNREQQEDACALKFQNPSDPSSDVLAIIADGMGGHAGGEIASQIVTKEFYGAFTKERSISNVQSTLNNALQAANQGLAEAVEANPNLRGMGSTLIGALISKNMIHWISVGDSHIYRFRKGKLQKLNADHSVYGELMELVQRKVITEQEAKAHPRPNALRSALMGQKIKLIDEERVKIEQNDIFIFATDGLDTLSVEEITNILNQSQNYSAQYICDELIKAIHNANIPKQDNTTIIIVHASLSPNLETAPPKPSFSSTPFTQSSWKKLVLIGGIAILIAMLFLYQLSRNEIELNPDPEELSEPAEDKANMLLLTPITPPNSTIEPNDEDEINTQSDEEIIEEPSRIDSSQTDKNIPDNNIPNEVNAKDPSPIDEAQEK